jgi:hypothetical protein
VARATTILQWWQPLCIRARFSLPITTIIHRQVLEWPLLRLGPMSASALLKRRFFHLAAFQPWSPFVNGNATVIRKKELNWSLFFYKRGCQQSIYICNKHSSADLQQLLQPLSHIHILVSPVVSSKNAE